VSVGGVTIDMNLINHLEVAQDQQTVDAGSGSTIYTLYHGLEAFNLTTIGARAADVGLGGFALGGGISNLAPK
jgi:FAD/FMN-containing dehydrogenase